MLKILKDTILVILVTVFLQCFFAFKPDAHLISTYGKESYDDIKHKLSLLTKNERDDLTCFLGYSMVFAPGAYTLFGDKPLTLVDHMKLKPAILKNVAQAHVVRCACFERGYKTWLTKKHLFQGTKYHFSSYHSKQQNDPCYRFALVKVDALDGPLRLPDDRNDHYRIGTLLGFGHENSSNFVRRLELRAKAKTGDKQAKLELKIIQEKLKGIRPEKKLKFFFAPAFVGDPDSEETKAIINRHKHERKLIRNLYANRDFLLVTLLELSQ